MRDFNQGLSLIEQRLRLGRLVFGLVVLLLLGRLAYWQLWQHVTLSQAAEAQYATSRAIQTQRGTIFDRHGQVMATNQERYTLFAEPPVLTADPPTIVDKLWPILATSLEIPAERASDEAWLKTQSQNWQNELVSTLSATDRKWLPLWHRLDRTQRDQINGLSLTGLGFDPREYRLYPDASVSAHILGFVGKNEQGEDQGYFGVEGYYDLELRGRAGREERQTTALGLPIALGQSQQLRAQPGRDLVLTIDKALQFRVEQALLAGIERYGAASGEVVIMDPHNGEILAMAAFPNYDPSHFLDFDPKDYRNPAIADLYEPGSTFKILTVAAGLEEGVITPETQCPDCDGPRLISGSPIRTWDEQYHPNINIRDALALSDNTAMVFVQEQLGKESFLSWLRRFGLDQKTGIDLQGEEQYLFRPDDQWRTIDIATASFGQGIAVSSLSLVRAASAIANGGFLIQPHVVQSVIDQGVTLPVETDPPQTILSPETTRTVTDLMINAVQKGDAKWVAPQDMVVAGKTGTAQIAEKGKYLEDKTIASFIGFAPADHPEFVMLVKLREPTTSPWGSETAAPLWFQIAHFLR